MKAADIRTGPGRNMSIRWLGVQSLYEPHETRLEMPVVMNITAEPIAIGEVEADIHTQ
jgi:hypothetical protein